MTRLAAAALLAFSACGTRGSSRAATSASSIQGADPARGAAPAAAHIESPLTVATYNINFGNGHLSETVEAIAALDADIILLQETTEASEAAIRARLSADFADIRFHHCCRAGGLGVLSRYAISDAEVVPTDIGFFPAWWLRVRTPAGPVVLVDVHLRPPISDSGSWLVGFFSTRGVRAEEIAALWAHLPQGEPIIVAGDFNEEAKGGVAEFLRGKGLKPSLPQFAGNEPTWHWKVGATTLRMQLDHVTYSDTFEAVSAKVVRGGLSDHEPVVVELRRVSEAATL